MHRRLLAFLTVLAALTGLMAARPTPTEASHSWNGYHWARTTNPFTLKLGDNVSSVWDGHLMTASSNWSQSTVLDTTVVAGGNKSPRNCRATSGRVEVCNAAYGFNGWLGVAQIWLSGSHITQGTTKMNDSYFNTSTYNKPEWRQLVMCQEVGHTFGLDHQDENFDNPNLGTCMDYTSNPLGPPSNVSPNQHDYDELVTIYSHLDSTTTVDAMAPGPGRGAAPGSPFGDEGPNDPPQFGRPAGPRDSFGRDILYVLDLPDGRRLFTHVFWALPGSPGAPPARVR
jgi:hypothetical protein